MTTYCFKCPECGYQVEQSVREPAPTCNHADALYFVSAAGISEGESELVVPPECAMNRDWRAEGVMVDDNAFKNGAGSPASPGGIRKKLVSGNVPDPW